jgi:phosphonate transport system substrate-binding protein
MKKIVKYIALLILLSIPLLANQKEKLTLGFMPYLSSKVLLEKYTPFANYLSQKLNKDIEIVIAKDYTQHLKNTGEDKIDISFLGGSPYVAISQKYGKKPLLARYEFNNKPTFNSVIFVKEDSKIKTLKELKGKSIAFGSPKSTLSSQVPLYMLIEAGIGLDDLSSYKYLRNHENVIYGVVYGDFSAGAASTEVFNEKKHEGIRALEFSKELSTHLFVTRSNIEKELFEKIKGALLELDDAKILQSISDNLTGFTQVQDSDYDYHRRILNKILPILENQNGKILQ